MASASEPVRGHKRKSPKSFELDFKVFKDKAKLKLVKPDEGGSGRSIKMKPCDYPTVMVKSEGFDDHALHIMHSLNHKSIMCMKALYEPKAKGDENRSLVALIEEVENFQELGSMDNPVFFADEYGHIPSDSFQRILREIVDGIDFLKRSGTYHGNLLWGNSCYNSSRTVKLANFKKKEDASSVDEAQWADWTSFLAMLEEFVPYISTLKQLHGREFFTDLLDELIGILKASDIRSLHVIKDNILKSMFFWTPVRRGKFFRSTVSPLLYDEKFMADVEDSDVCELPWNSPHEITSVNTLLENLLDKMNSFRDGIEIDHYKVYSKKDCVKCICGAYTHKSEIQINVDVIVRAKYPKMAIELKRLIDNYYSN